MGNAAFYNTSIISIKFGEGLTEIKNSSFTYCINLQNEIIIPDNIIEIKKGAFANTSISSIKYGNNLAYIGNYGFQYCCNLVCELVLPKSLTYIGECCIKLTRIHGVVDGSRLSHIGDYSFMESKITGFILPYTKNEGIFLRSTISWQVILSETVREIKIYAFAYTPLEKINFLNTLKEIGDYAFTGCNNLKSSVIDKIVVNTI